MRRPRPRVCFCATVGYCKGSMHAESDPLQTAAIDCVRLRLIGLYLRCIEIVDSRKVTKIKKTDRVLTHVFERFSENSKRFGSLQRPRWRGKGKELANSGSIVRLGLGGVSGKRGVVPTIVRSQRPWSESWGASPRHRIKGGWLSGDSTSIPYLDAIHGKTVNNRGRLQRKCPELFSCEEEGRRVRDAGKTSAFLQCKLRSFHVTWGIRETYLSRVNSPFK
jgi:hypothetical protein